MRHTRRKFKSNVQKTKIYDPATKTYKTMKVSTSYIRTLAKRMQAGKKV